MARITLIRHGETTANVAELLQGREDAPLTPRGKRQLARAAARLADLGPFDLVVSSPQGRARASAAGLGFPDPEMDPALAEGDPGAWEGLTRAEIVDRFPDEFGRLAAGEDIPIGGGERRSELRARSMEALERIASRVGPDGRALVVTHGGVVSSVAAALLRINGGRWPLARVLNTALSTVEVGQHRRMLSFNDDSHLDVDDRDGYRAGSATHIVLMRHGQTEANAAGVWQGSLPGVLDDVGKRQAQRLADVAPDLDALYSSPLQRALDTAAPLSTRRGLPIHVDDGLAEMAMGQWEGMTTTEIENGYPEVWSTLYERGEDVPRGLDGETFFAVAARMRRSIESIVAAHPGQTVGVVSHGAALRAFLGTVVGFGFTGRNVMPSMANTALSRVMVPHGSTRSAMFPSATSSLATFNVRP